MNDEEQSLKDIHLQINEVVGKGKKHIKEAMQRGIESEINCAIEMFLAHAYQQGVVNTIKSYKEQNNGYK